MSDQLQAALTALILKLTNGITTVTDQLPELVHQLIGFHIMKYWIWVGAEMGTLLILPPIIYILLAKVRSDYCGTAFALGIICSAAGISMIMDVIQLAKLYNFPLVWVLDYLKEAAN